MQQQQRYDVFSFPSYLSCPKQQPLQRQQQHRLRRFATTTTIISSSGVLVEEGEEEKEESSTTNHETQEQEQQQQQQGIVQTTNSEETIEIIVNVPDTINIPGAEKGGKKLAIVYTCTICNTRSMKQFTYRAYHYGVVIIRCPKCLKQHLIADRLGYFQEVHDSEINGFDLSTIAKRYGHSYKRIVATTTTTDSSDKTIDDVDSSSAIETTTTKVSLEDLIGADKMREILQTVQQTKESGSNNNNKNSDDDTKSTST